MIRVRHLPLPTGLNAFVRKGADGDMEVFVSDGLDPGRARAAVRLALRSFGPAGRTAGLLPIPVALLLAGGLLYIAGAISYRRRRPNPYPSVFGYHEVFHVYVCAAATCQFIAIALFIA